MKDSEAYEGLAFMQRSRTNTGKDVREEKGDGHRVV
jgi:hypothetical protein